MTTIAERCSYSKKSKRVLKPRKIIVSLYPLKGLWVASAESPIPHIVAAETREEARELILSLYSPLYEPFSVTYSSLNPFS